MANDDDTTLIDELLNIIERLELHERVREQEIDTLRTRLTEMEQLLSTYTVASTIAIEETAEPQITDRDGTVLQIGHAVHILTRGVHREHYGYINTISERVVTIRDRTGINQNRAPHNVRVDPLGAHRFAHE